MLLIKFVFHRFVCKNNGVLFENDLIQIGVKSEFRQNLGRLGLFYGNKTSVTLGVSKLVLHVGGGRENVCSSGDG